MKIWEILKEDNKSKLYTMHVKSTNEKIKVKIILVSNCFITCIISDDNDLFNGYEIEEVINLCDILEADFTEVD